MKHEIYNTNKWQLYIYSEKCLITIKYNNPWNMKQISNMKIIVKIYTSKLWIRNTIGNQQYIYISNMKHQNDIFSYTKLAWYS